MTLPAQDTWQTPPEPIASMLKAKQLPAVGFSPNNEWIVECGQTELPPLYELSAPQVAIAGFQVNPRVWEPAKAGYFISLAIRRRDETIARPVKLPENPRIRNLSWSRDSRYISFTQTTTDVDDQRKNGVSLWVLEMETGEVRSLTGPILNSTFGNPNRWLPDNTLICKVRADDSSPPKAPTLPIGPIIEESLGRVAPAQTYTNLLKNRHDEALLEYYLTSKIVRISLDGSQTPVMGPDLFKSIAPSPDGQWLKITTAHRPFSYQVTISRFPVRVEVFDVSGKPAYTVTDLPLAEEIPINFDSVREGIRSTGWRADKPATLYLVEALDDGDADKKSEYRDCISTLDAPFTREPKTLWKTTLRFNTILWGDGDTAIAYEAMYNTRTLRVWRIAPDRLEQAPKLLEERNFQDAYSNPGNPVSTPGEYGWRTLLLSEAGDMYLDGRGASAEGVRPFLDRLNLETGEKERLWRSPADIFSRVEEVLDGDASELIVQKESKTEPENYYLYNRAEKAERPLSYFSDPLPWYSNIHKEVVRYSRADGLELSGTLYLPPGHDLAKDGPLPTLLWVYPEEHKSRETASQITRAENTFARPSRSSVMFMLTQGYALLSGPSMPIIGEGQIEPNDTYLEQLLDSATAAVNYLVKKGVCERDRIAIGGHSYGAFTTANLLAHSDLFCAGIARSGAYNRSLTPFGFQGEQRNFWDATDAYMKMSPFVYADKIKQPLLLIHGAADDNSGTYPIQSDRLYEAMKGLGGTVRYVSLPYEEHGYRSKEAVGHVLWEMVRWLDTYVKRAGEK